MSEQLPEQQHKDKEQIQVNQTKAGTVLPQWTGAYGVQQITVKTTNVPTLPVKDVESLYRLSPNYAERAIALVEEEARFRHGFAQIREQNVYRERVLGLSLGALIAVVGIVCGVVSAWLDHPGIASLLVGSSLIGVVSLIVAYSHGDYKKKEDETKKQPNQVKNNRQ